MSNEPKKYPPDTPLTMGLLIKIYDSNGKKGPADFWRKQIEPPKPEPKDGEMWLCSLNNTGDKVALWKQPRMWCVYHSGNCHGWGHEEVFPIKRLIPAEGSDE